MHGHIAETFSAGPLAAIAAVLLTGKLPALFAAPEKGLRGAARTDTRVRDFGVLCTDYAGPVAGCRVALKERAAA
jgi:hypothetical protein